MEESAAGPSSDSQTKKGLRKAAAGGATPLLGRRRRNEARPRGRTVSATSHRETLSLTVCGVGPSRSLELCASSRPITTSEIRQRSRDGHVNQLHCSTSLPSIGYLRSARLYPLGVVDTPLLQPPELLGIVANSRRIGDRRRPVSWVETRTRAELDKRKANSERDRERDRHSFSGYPEGRSRLISLPKNTALVPTASMSVESARKQKQTNIFTSGQSQAHPPLVSQKLAACEEGQEIRVEVRSSRESSDSNRQPVEDQTASGGTLPHLPPVTNLSSSQLQQPRIKESERKISQQISIVSVGATGTSVVRQQRQVQWRRQRSPDRRDGRLSLGWTQTKPLGPLTGFSVYRDTESRTQTRGELSGSKEAKTALGGGGAGEAVVSKDCILIDVQEYLANIN